jgi:hypothetical protein
LVSRQSAVSLKNKGSVQLPIAEWCSLKSSLPGL